MEEYTIGRLLKGVRKEYGLTRKELGQGVVSEDVLKGVEEDIWYLDKMTQDFLLARVGLSSLFYECYIDDEEFRLYDQRITIRKIVSGLLRDVYENNVQEADEQIEKGRQCCRKYRRSRKRLKDRFSPEGTIHQFFEGVMEAYFLLVEDAVHVDRHRAGKRVRQIWSVWSYLRTETWEVLKEGGWPYLSVMELECLMLAACAYESDGMREEAKLLLYAIWEYRNHHEQEIEEQVKIYPYVIRCLAELEVKDGNEQRAFSLCAEAMEMLAEANSLRGQVSLMNFMLEHWCEDSGYYGNRKELESQRDCLLELYQMFEENPYAVYPMMEIENAVLASEAVKRGRKSIGMTQRMLGEGIVEPETISRFETGKLRLKWKTVEKLLERLGMKAKKNWMLIECDKAVTVRRYCRIGTYVGAWQTRAATEQLGCLERELDMRSVVNRQVMGYYKITIQGQKYQKKPNDMISKEYEKLLQLTFPAYFEGNWGNVFLDRNEATLINAMALNQERRNRSACAAALYKACLENLEKRFVNMRYPKQYIQFIKGNMANTLGNMGEINMAISLSKEVLKQELHYGCGKGMADVLYEIAWNLKELEKKEKDDKNDCKIYFALAWNKALLEQNREFIIFLEERKEKYEN